MNKDEIIKAIKIYDDEYGKIDWDESESMERLIEYLSCKNLCPIYLQGANCGSDYWYEAQVHSKAIKKTIVWNTDFEINMWENAEELADELIQIDKDIKEFESHITWTN